MIDLSQTLSELTPVEFRTYGGTQLDIGRLMFGEICLSAIPALWEDTYSYCPTDDSSVAAHHQLLDELKAFLSIDDVRGIYPALESPPCSTALAAILYGDLLYLVGQKCLADFYKNTRSPEGWYRNGPDLFTGYGRPLDTHAFETPHGLVTVAVSRYTNDTGARTKPYEWLATLQKDPRRPNSPIDAYACGMVYVGPKRIGARSASDLMTSADAVADVDVLQVRAFLEQSDAESIWEQSDLCFIWLWERAEHAGKGAGAACLKAAVSDIKKRFGTVRTVIFDCQPMQFKLDTWSATDPAEIVEDRLEATTCLQDYTALLGLGDAVGGELKFIANIHHGDQFAALAALGSIWAEG